MNFRYYQPTIRSSYIDKIKIITTNNLDVLTKLHPPSDIRFIQWSDRKCKFIVGFIKWAILARSQKLGLYLTCLEILVM